MSDVLERTTIQVTSRILKNEFSDAYYYEIVLGILPIDDVVRWESRQFKSLSHCVLCMMTKFPENVKNLIEEYEP